MPTDVVMILRLLLAAALGAAIGFQREKSHKQAGFRTHILISFGSALFTVVSIYGFGLGSVDVSRVAAGVVTGIGFLGAGAIIHPRGGGIVAGLTTAASIWTMAAIGLAAGTGLYLVAVAATVIALVVLLLPHPRVQ